MSQDVMKTNEIPVNQSLGVLGIVIKISVLSFFVGASFGCNNDKPKPKGSSGDVTSSRTEENQGDTTVDTEETVTKEGKKKKGADAAEEMPEEMSEAQPATPAAKAPEIPPKLGFRNFESAHSTMAALTGIPKTNARVGVAYNANKVSLLTDPSVKSLTSSSVVGLFKLSSTYCDELTKDAALRTSVFGTFDFAGLPQTVLAEAGKKQVAETLVTKFWGKDLAKLPPHDANVAMVVEIITELLAMNTANTAATTLRVVSGACTATLMSSQAMLY